MIKNIFLVRHGQSEHNLRNVFAGSSVNEKLTSKGENDAALVSKEISKSNEVISHIFHSPLRRSRQTALIIQNNLEKKYSQKIKMTCIDGLVEVNVGLFSGKSQEEVKKLYLTSAEYFQNRDFENWDFPSGENYHQILDRVEKAMQEILKFSQNSKSIIVVGHAMINRVIISRYFSKEIAKSKKFHFDHQTVMKIKLEGLDK